MSVLIQGMAMPESCSVCKLSMTTERWELVCKLLNCYASDVDRETECPLIEIPPHGRLIDADELYEVLDGGYDVDLNELPETKAALLKMIESTPTVIPADKEERRNVE